MKSEKEEIKDGKGLYIYRGSSIGYWPAAIRPLSPLPSEMLRVYEIRG